MGLYYYHRHAVFPTVLCHGSEFIATETRSAAFIELASCFFHERVSPAFIVAARLATPLSFGDLGRRRRLAARRRWLYLQAMP